MIGKAKQRARARKRRVAQPNNPQGSKYKRAILRYVAGRTHRGDAVGLLFHV